MDIQRINSVLNKAIIQLQESEIELMVEKTMADIAPKNKWVKFSPSMLKDSDLQKEIFDVIQIAYGPIGGHLKIRKSADIAKEIEFLTAIDLDDDPHVDAAIFGKPRGSKIKFTGMGQDGSSASKSAAMKKWAEDLKKGKAFAEVSGAIAHITINKLGASTLPEKDVRSLLPDKKIEWVGKHPSGKYPDHPHWYRRKIGGEHHLKIVVGKKGA